MGTAKCQMGLQIFLEILEMIWGFARKSMDLLGFVLSDTPDMQEEKHVWSSFCQTIICLVKD